MAAVKRANSVKLQKEFKVSEADPEEVVKACLGDGCENCHVQALVEECGSERHSKLRARAKKHFLNSKAWHDKSLTLEENFKRFVAHVSKDLEKGKKYLQTHKKKIIYITIALICFIGLCGVHPLVAVGALPAVLATVLPSVFGMGFKEFFHLAFDG